MSFHNLRRFLYGPEIQQYFVESNIDGRPFSREFRSIIYQRSKGDLDTRPLGTQRDVHRIGYEWMNHSLAPERIREEEDRIANRLFERHLTAPVSEALTAVADREKDRVRREHQKGCRCSMCDFLDRNGWPP